MKKNVSILTAVVVLAIGSVYLAAATTSTLRVDVPFAFVVGKTSLPAGQYIVQFERLGQGSALGTCIVVKSETGKIYERVSSRPASDPELTAQAKLIFNRYGSSYFLARVESYGLTCDLKKSPVEKELAARMNQKAHPVPVAAD